MRLTVEPGGAVVVTAPIRAEKRSIEQFLTKHRPWLEKATERMRFFKRIQRGRREYMAQKDTARVFVEERVKYWNQFYRFPHNRIAVKNTKTIWGSCSRKGNLNFSFALTSLPAHLADYVVVHELCHLREHNHSPAFWKLVAGVLPEYVQLRRELRRYVLTT